ncbi:MAG TPA: GAF domain-containing protein [Chloroflexota bacterium]|nr:GAF domain-containing protein [Chloroflexota bacterium]
MSSTYGETATDLLGLLREVVVRMKQIAQADIVALYPFDADSETFYAPVAIGISDEGLLHSLPDMADQLRRYRADAEQGKVPEDLQPAQYGPNVWLKVTHRALVAEDTPSQLDSSFIRRNKIRSVVGLPLLAGTDLVALLYLNYVEHEGSAGKTLLTPTRIAELEAAAAEAAVAIEQARKAEDLAAFRATTELVGQFSTIVPDGDGAVAAFHAQIERALAAVLHATGTDAAAIYALDDQGRRLDLIAAQGLSGGFAAALPIASSGQPWNLASHPELQEALLGLSLHELAVLPLRGRGTLVVEGKDPLALTRKPASVRLFLQAAADLIGGALENRSLVEAMEGTNRTFMALTALGRALALPGASQDQVLRAVVAQLTDPAIPEFDFQFATVFLLGNSGRGEMIVRRAAGATSTDIIDSVPIPGENGGSPDPGIYAHASQRVPRWVLQGERHIDSRDILSFVARQQRTVVIAALADTRDLDFVNGFPDQQLERLQIPVARGPNQPADLVRAVLLRGPNQGIDPAAATRGMPQATRDIQLQGDLFDASGHAQLLRVFVPFGADPAAGGQATGVLEAGYHISRKRQLDRLQIEALNAAAAQIASAVETAHLFEDSRKRAEHLEIVTEVSRMIASSIDLEQTLHLVARNMARIVDASTCLIALFEDDGSAWFGAAASHDEDLWRRQRVERPEPSIIFEVAERGAPIAVEDARANDLVRAHLIRLFGIRSLVALPLLVADGPPIGAVILAQTDRQRLFTSEEVLRASALTQQAALAIQNASLHAREEEEHHIQKDVILIGFGQWGQKAYQHLLTLKQFFNFKTHVVEQEREGRRVALAELEQQVIANGDAFYWDSIAEPAREVLERELEPSCYVITYIVTPAETHLPVVKQYYDLSNVILIEKPLGAPLEDYRAFLDSVDGSVQLVAADHYYFKLEVRLLQLLLTEERTLRAFLDEIEEIEIQVLEAQPPTGSGAQIGMIADLVPHAFAILSLFTPLDRLQFSGVHPLQIGRYQPSNLEKETFARLVATYPHKGRQVRVIIDAGKGVADAKWIKLSGEKRAGGKRSFYKFDFGKGVAIDGTQTNLRAATRNIRQPGVPDNAHISMLRHVIEKKRPAVGILAIREAMRSNQRIQELEALAAELMHLGIWTPYEQGQRPAFLDEQPARIETSRREEAAHVG